VTGPDKTCFSVFESVVRDQVLSDVEDEKSRLRHPVIVKIVNNAAQEIEHGSFYRELQVFKGLDASLRDIGGSPADRITEGKKRGSPD
jgi:hypothetical protein